MSLLRGDRAPLPRTLVDIVTATVDAHPDEPAIDNGETVLTYAEFAEAAEDVALDLALHGIGVGDRVGIRITSGTADLYVAILGTLLAGAAYVPVDADDPDERARTVFGESAVAGILTDGLLLAVSGAPREPIAREDPAVEDDAWIIFTSGSTGIPKGVAVTHRSAAAFVDAESRMFLQDRPIGPGDRVMAGLSVGFDASCEEMWLAWRYGACLVPAPRSLVRSGTDLGPWLVANRVTIVSTVPTLVLLWPADALDAVRLLILGGEACPPEIGLRFAVPQREVWNTYGPTEATVVACGARVRPEEPVRIGLPLDGWDLAVVDGAGSPVAPGEVGELIIGGVGLARYLDPAKDAEKYAAMPTLGWARAYRSGDLVRTDDAGLLFQGRADDQVKVGGRRIELGELDSVLLALPGVVGAAAAVRRSRTGNALLIGYVTTSADFDQHAAMEILRRDQPAALVPRLAVVDDLPTRTSGKIDRDALPWPVPRRDTAAGAADSDPAEPMTETESWVAALWRDVLGVDELTASSDFFDLGGGSLTAAQVVGLARSRHPEVTVAEVYEHPRLGAFAAHLAESDGPAGPRNRPVSPVRGKTQLAQLLATIGLRAIPGLRWTTFAATGADLARLAGAAWAPTVSWWWVALGWLLLVAAPGRMLLAALGTRTVLRGLAPGAYPRGGKVHLRVWLAERLTDELGATRLSGAPLIRWYARLLGAHIGRGVDLHTVPPVTGMLHLGDGCSLEPEVDLTGHWLDGDRLHVGPIRVGRHARVGARSTLAPGADIGSGAEVAPGSTVIGRVGTGEAWSGSPARRVGDARGPWEGEPPRRRRWTIAYAASALLIDSLPVLALLAGLGVLWPGLRGARDAGEALSTAYTRLVPATLVTGLALLVLVWALVRLLAVGLTEGHHAVHSRQGWQAWSTIRVLDDARWWLYPIYASSVTPTWLRALGARIGSHVEASTVLMIPSMTTVGDGAFLADDTLIGGYELGGGWLRVGRVKIGKRAFVGNSGMAAPGRKVPKAGLVAVLSAAPRRGKAKAGTSWVGSPPERLRRQGDDVDAARSFAPPARLKVLRALVECCRFVPVLGQSALVLAIVASLLWLAGRGWWLAALLSGPVLMAAGLLAATAAVVAKWVLVGRVRRSEHPLWSSFVWRNELADAFVELLAAPWFARPATGTPALVMWLRAMGARIGQGVWVDTYWLPEPDLIDLRDGATVNAGCVVQTHLFHDRLLRIDTVSLREGATLGPNGVVLPAAVIGRHATIGPGSLVMRGEVVPDRTRWIGNPIGPWNDPSIRHDGAVAEAGDAGAEPGGAAATGRAMETDASARE